MSIVFILEFRLQLLHREEKCVHCLPTILCAAHGQTHLFDFANDHFTDYYGKMWENVDTLGCWAESESVFFSYFSGERQDALFRDVWRKVSVFRDSWNSTDVFACNIYKLLSGKLSSYINFKVVYRFVFWIGLWDVIGSFDMFMDLWIMCSDPFE